MRPIGRLPGGAFFMGPKKTGAGRCAGCECADVGCLLGRLDGLARWRFVDVLAACFSQFMLGMATSSDQVLALVEWGWVARVEHPVRRRHCRF
jgi:hypothetical protein